MKIENWKTKNEKQKMKTIDEKQKMENENKIGRKKIYEKTESKTK